MKKLLLAILFLVLITSSAFAYTVRVTTLVDKREYGNVVSYEYQGNYLVLHIEGLSTKTVYIYRGSIIVLEIDN